MNITKYMCVHGHWNKAYQGVIRILQEFGISGFEQWCDIAKQVSTGFEVEIKFKDHHIQWKRTYLQ